MHIGVTGVHRHGAVYAQAALKVILMLFICCFVFGNAVFPQEAGKPKSVNFDSYQFSQFISAAGQSPQQITKLDNNGEILLACIKGKTREQLHTVGIQFGESQIELLKTWRLLEEKEAILKTEFPILDAEMSQQLREASLAITPALGRQIEPNVLRLAAILDHNGRKRNAYPILFAYILDSLVWDKLRERNLLGQRVITTETPLWAGEVWAVYPPRAFSMGTNTVSDKGISLHVNWTERAIPRMIPFVADIKTFLRMFGDYVERGRVEDEHARKVFGPFDLFDSTGRFTVPIIRADRRDPVHKLSEEIARQIADSLSTVLDLQSLSKQFGFRDNRQALVIVYHELMWDLMDQLESRGIVQKPLVLAAPDTAKQSDVADLVFIVRKIR
jgi:hypothetical protein